MTNKNKHTYSIIIATIVVLLIGIFFRFTSLNWDQGHHLHPDERFLNMLINDLDIPESWQEYFDPQQSSLNPRNHQRDFFVYGNWPITIGKYASVFFKTDGLEEIALNGRHLSAAADTITIIFVFLTVYLLEKKVEDKTNLINKNTKIWAALVYALLVLPIQQSHFFTTDTFLNLFCFSSTFFLLLFFFEDDKSKKNKYIPPMKQLLPLVISALLFGFALGSKISAILFAPLLLGLIVLKNFAAFYQNKNKAIAGFFTATLIFTLIAYLSLRVASPYMFANKNLLSPTLEPAFLQNLKQLKSWEGNAVWFPPAIQWINRPVTFGVVNLAFFGMGLASFSFLLIGAIMIILPVKSWVIALIDEKFKLKNTSNNQLMMLVLLILLWLTSFLLYYTTQFVTTLRYFLPIYSFLAILASIGITGLLNWIKYKTLSTGLIFLSLAVWPLMFISVYFHPHSRVQASQWIYSHIPLDSTILVEHWDDALPLHLPEYSYRYEIIQLPVFDPDTQEKWETINNQLSIADYYILTSNRAWNSIPRVPEKYPLMSQFYIDLFEGKTDYQLVTVFQSFPGLKYLGLPIEFDDNWAEEAFTVYDHPQVHIFANTGKLNRKAE